MHDSDRRLVNNTHSLENRQVISDILSRAPRIHVEPVSEPDYIINVNLVEELGSESSALKRLKETASIYETS